MILSDGTVISKADVSPHKFGGDPMAEYLWVLSLDSSQDRQTGDACDWSYWVAQFGKRLLWTNSQGFVWVEKYDSVALANVAFDEMELQFAEWDDQEDDE